MKKVAIITINDYNNYGNRLQNYAAQEVLKSLDCSVETIKNNVSPVHNQQDKNGLIRRMLQKFGEISVNELYSRLRFKLWRIINAKKIEEQQNKRFKSFKSFTTTYIKETNYIISKGDIPEDLSEQYDFFLTGSDQVWNPIFRYGSTIDFLTFAPKNKRIAYAPSFGISKIPPEYIERYKNWLEDISYLSVREKAGASIIKELTGRDATVLVDPTLMLTKEEWLLVAQPAKNKPQKKYLLTYFLGGIPSEHKKRIYGIAKENDLQVVNLADIKEAETYVTGPSEFIDFINSASVFCTDSFHGVVFSILMETPFIVFEREGNLPSMNSRIETILSTFKLESRHIRNIREGNILGIDYSHVGPILECERNKAITYLKEALNINKDDLNNTKSKEVGLE